MSDWNDYFYGEEACETSVEFDRRETQYQAFKDRFLSEVDLVEVIDD